MRPKHVPSTRYVLGVTAESLPQRPYTLYARSVYTTCMSRTNILIDDNLLDIVMRRYGLHTKTEAVDVALRSLAGRPMTTDEALSMRGARLVGEVVDDQAPR